MSDLIHRAPAADRFVVGFGGNGFDVLAALDQQPWFFARLTLASAHAHQSPLAFQLFSFEPEMDFPFLVSLGGLAVDDLVMATVPKHDRARAVIAFGNGSFEPAILKRMV